MGFEPADWTEARTFEEYVIQCVAENIERKKEGLPFTLDYISLIEVWPKKGRIQEIWKKYQASLKIKL